MAIDTALNSIHWAVNGLGDSCKPNHWLEWLSFGKLVFIPSYRQGPALAVLGLNNFPYSEFRRATIGSGAGNVLWRGSPSLDPRSEGTWHHLVNRSEVKFISQMVVASQVVFIIILAVWTLTTVPLQPARRAMIKQVSGNKCPGFVAHCPISEILICCPQW